jgi:hypothetical protein
MALLVAVVSPRAERSPRPASTPRWTASLAVAGLVMGCLVSIAVTHDYMSWNRARWQLLDEWVGNRGVEPGRIDGGFEFNGWYFGQRIEDCAPGRPRPSRGEARWEDFACLEPPVTTDREYRVSFRAATDMSVKDQRSFSRWLPWRRQSVFLLRRND